MGVAERGGEGQGLGGTHINISSIDTHPTKGMRGGGWGVSGGMTDICFHAYAYTIKWEGPVADWYRPCREWQRQVGPSNRLCPNLRICSSSCLHNEVK